MGTHGCIVCVVGGTQCVVCVQACVVCLSIIVCRCGCVEGGVVLL